jgi:predicted transcriptional regulator
MKNSIAKMHAFQDQLNSGKVLHNSMRVYKSLLENPQTIHSMRTKLSMAHQSLTATLSNLEDMGMVYKDSTVKVDGKSFTVYKAETDFKNALKRAEAMEQHKLNEWIRRGIANGWLSKSLEILPLNDVDADLLD